MKENGGGVVGGGGGGGLTGRRPAAVTLCKPPIKAGLNPPALFPAGSVMEASPDGSRSSTRPSVLHLKPPLSILREGLRWWWGRGGGGEGLVYFLESPILDAGMD